MALSLGEPIHYYCRTICIFGAELRDTYWNGGPCLTMNHNAQLILNHGYECYEVIWRALGVARCAVTRVGVTAKRQFMYTLSYVVEMILNAHHGQHT